MYKLGSNQYKSKDKEFLGLHAKTWASVWFVVATVAIVAPLLKHEVIDPCGTTGCHDVVKAAEPELTEQATIVAEIATVFEPEGAKIVAQAIYCFSSEGATKDPKTGKWIFNPKAVNESNSNGTIDRGIAQINSVHGMKPEDAFDFKKNIRKAYQIYKSRGNFTAWYGSRCN